MAATSRASKSFTEGQGGMQGAQGSPQLSSELVPPSGVPPFLLLLLGLEGSAVAMLLIVILKEG